MTHCKRVRFTVLLTCSDELAVHLNQLFCLQRQVAKLGSELFYYWPLLRNNNMATIFEDALEVTVVGVLPHVTIERRQLAGNGASETVISDC